MNAIATRAPDISEVSPRMAAIFDRRVQDLPFVRQLSQVVLLGGALAAGLWMFNWTQQPSYSPLFTGLTDKDAAEVIAALQGASVPYRIDAGSGAISVPEAKAHETRLKLASLGLPHGGRAGFEMIEGEQGFGVSQFVEGARFQLALETELARSIATLHPVADARVHLAIPKPSAFTREREPAGASVLLNLYSGRSLDSSQVSAIVHMVATSVPNLAPERVTLIDQNGRMLSVPDPNSDAAVSNRQFEQVQRLENAYTERVVQLLEPLTGVGRVSARVAVDMDFAVTEEARESFAPEVGKLRSEQTQEQSSSGSTSAVPPGATANTPPQAQTAQFAEGSGSGTNSASRVADRRFELDRTLTHTRQAPGRVKRVSVAVLIDNIPGVKADGTADLDAAGRPILRALKDEEIARVQSLVREAVGFDQARGDTASVMNAPFARPEPMTPLEPLPLWQNQTVIEWSRIIGGALVVLALLFGVLRPAVRQILAPPRLALPEDTESEQTDEELAEAQLTAVTGSTEHVPTAQEEAAGLLAPPNSYETKLTVAKAAVAQDPRRVAQVVRGWVGGDG